MRLAPWKSPYPGVSIVNIIKKTGLLLATAMALATVGVATGPAPSASAADCWSGSICYQEVGGPYPNSLENCKNDHWTRYVRAQRLWPNKSISASGCYRTNVNWGWNFVITVWN